MGGQDDRRDDGWERVAARVEALVGTPGHPTDLGGSTRSHVWRVPVGDASYVVKVHLEEGDTYAREAAALAALDGLGVAPGLVASADDERLLVMEDLGGGPNLADAILGSDRDVAAGRLEQWALGVAALHRASSAEVLDRFSRRLGALAPGVVADDLSPSTDFAVQRYRTHLPDLGVGPGRALDVLAQVPGMLSPARVLSPTDTCPDNNLVDRGALRLLDFESATVWHPAWDVAYLRVPFPSCWCAWALPAEQAGRAEQRYREVVDLPERFEDDLALVTLAWCVMSVGWFLPRAVEPADPDAEDERIPPRRAMVLHRLALAAASPADDELSGFAGRLHDRLVAEWGTVDLELGPAWRSDD